MAKLITGDGIEYSPNTKQSLFHSTKKRERLFCGGVGSGKTLTGCIEGIKLSLKYPNNRGFVGRATYQELEDTTKRIFLEVLPDKCIDDIAIKQNRIVFVNKSEVVFRSLDKPTKLKSMQLGWAFIDELTEIPYTFYAELKRRLRWSGVPERFIFASSNSDSPLHWVYNYFYSYRIPDGQGNWKELKQSIINNIFVVETSSLDNTIYLPKDYIEDLNNMDEESIKRYRDALWVYFSGIIYPLKMDIHILSWSNLPEELMKCAVIKDKILTGWKFDAAMDIIIGIDKGFSNPASISIFAEVVIGGDSHYFKIMEYYKRGADNIEIADALLTFIKDYGIISYKCYVDPSASELIFKIKEKGMNCKGAENAVADGISYVRTLMNPLRNRFHIIKENCPNTIREYSTYKYKIINGVQTEEPMKVDDHTCDSDRYALFSAKKETLQVF